MVPFLQMDGIHVLPQLSFLDVPHLTHITLMVNSFSVNLLVGIKARHGFEQSTALVAAHRPNISVDLAVRLELVAIFAGLFANVTLVDLLSIHNNDRKTLVEVFLLFVNPPLGVWRPRRISFELYSQRVAESFRVFAHSLMVNHDFHNVEVEFIVFVLD